MSNIRRIKNSVLIDKNTDMRAYYLPATRSILNSNTRCRVSAECSHKKVDNLLYKMKELRAVGLFLLTLSINLINSEPSGDSAYL